METPTRFFWLNLYFFLRNWWRRFTHIVTQSAVGIVAQQVRANNGRRGEPQVGKLCGCNVLCAFSACACVRVRLVCVYSIGCVQEQVRQVHPRALRAPSELSYWPARGLPVAMGGRLEGRV